MSQVHLESQIFKQNWGARREELSCIIIIFSDAMLETKAELSLYKSKKGEFVFFVASPCKSVTLCGWIWWRFAGAFHHEIF